MSEQPPDPIVSGVEYAVQEVDGRQPTSDADFDGELVLRVSYDAPGTALVQEHVLRGVGMVGDDGVYFNEKGDQGKDVRRWRIVRTGEDGGYVAKQGLF